MQIKCNLYTIINYYLSNIFFLAAPNIISRAQWGARAPKSPASNLRLKPAPYVIIHHSTGLGCETEAACKQKVRGFQVINFKTLVSFLNSKHLTI